MSSEQDIRDWFKDHIVEQDNDIVIWRKPGTSCFLIRYHLRKGILSVSGDLGCATYQWHGSDIDFPFLAGCGLGYFEEKCQASENGRDHKEWNEESACKRVEELFEEDYGYNLEYKEEALGACESQFEWDHFMVSSGYEVFGSEFYEYGNIGMDISIRCEAHLIGLKMIQERKLARVGGQI